MAKRIAAIVMIFCLISIAWFVLGGSMSARSTGYAAKLSREVAGLWGDVQVQQAPMLEFKWYTFETVSEEVTDPVTKKTTLVKKQEKVLHARPVLLDSSKISVDFDLEHRQKGLLWYSTYGVDFAGRFAYTHAEDRTGWIYIHYAFPTANATYDDFRFDINGKSDQQIAPERTEENQTVTQVVPIAKGDNIDFSIGYKTRGLDYWRYAFGRNVSRVKDFALTMTTNFDAIDFPDGSMSPTSKEKAGDGWNLAWTFSNLISGFDIGMEMPKKLNPGPLASRISLFAPVCLLFFFVWIFVITLLRKVDLHPMNYLFIGAAFFAFNLLFSYTVDRVDLLPAFIASAAVSIFLVVSYLRLVTGIRFAAVEAGGAQFIYLILFSYAHFHQGWTGLIVTIGSIITLFVLMQLTGRINWSEKFAKKG